MDSMRRVLPILLAAAVLLAAAAVAGVGRPEAARGDDSVTRDTATTIGLGTVTTVPDVAKVSAGVDTEAATAAEALAQNSERMERVIAALRRAGGEKLQTQQVYLYPRSGERGETTGFVAQNTVSVKTKIAAAGELVDAGANTVEGPVLERSDREQLYRDALAQALRDARLKAESLADAGNFGVGKVVAVVEEGATPPEVYAADLSGATKEASSAPIVPGTQDVEARVTVSFEIA